MNLTAIEIYEKEFKISKDKGYDIEDINNYLDLIIEDYMQIEKMQIKLKELEIENQNLKIKISALKSSNREIDHAVPTVNNIDILKRLSRLEQAVFGKNNE